MEPIKDYLGDGVYVEWNGNYIVDASKEKNEDRRPSFNRFDG
jgi:hypothetical protein